MKTESFDLRQKGSWTEILETLFIWPRVPMRSSTLLSSILCCRKHSGTGTQIFRQFLHDYHIKSQYCTTQSENYCHVRNLFYVFTPPLVTPILYFTSQRDALYSQKMMVILPSSEYVLCFS